MDDGTHLIAMVRGLKVLLNAQYPEHCLAQRKCSVDNSHRYCDQGPSLEKKLESWNPFFTYTLGSFILLLSWSSLYLPNSLFPFFFFF